MKNIREELSELEHIQWEKWTHSLAQELDLVKHCIKKNDSKRALEILENRMVRWEKNWKPYSELSEKIKDYDRVWADKVLAIHPTGKRTPNES